jgi:hypothetical protein
VTGPTGTTGPTGPKGGVTFVISSTGDAGEFNVQGLAGGNPEMIAVRGEKMFFDVSGVLVTNSLALRLSQFGTSTVPGTTNNSATLGRNESSEDTIIVYDVPINAPSSIFYVDVTDPTNIAGVINVVDKVGPTGPTGADGPVGTPELESYTPVMAGTGLTFTSAPASGNFTRYGRNISFSIQVDCATISNFGSGNYQVTLPVLPESGVAYSFTGTLDLAGGFSGAVHVIHGQNELGSATIRLFFSGTNGLRTNVTGAAPVTLTTNSRLYISGSYIAQSAS